MIVIGIDPGIEDGKPLAIVLMDFDHSQSGMEIVYTVKGRLSRGRGLAQKYDEWHQGLVEALARGRQRAGTKPDLVVIEDGRPPNRGGAYFQTLVKLLKEQAERYGVPVVLVNPQKVKAAVAFGRSGKRYKEWVIEGVRMLVDCSELPRNKHGKIIEDYPDAVAVAIAGEAKWRKKQWKEAE